MTGLLGRTWLWASEKTLVQKLVTEHRFTQPVVKRFVAGDELEDAVAAIKELNARGIGGILDHLGEGVNDPEEAAEAAEAYIVAIHRSGETEIDTTISVKLTQLGLAFDKGRCIDHLRAIAAEAQAIEMGVEVDMEQSRYVLDTLDVFRILQADYPGMRIAIQAYLRRSSVDLETFAATRPHVRLVKGAYKEPEDIAFQRRKEIDAQYHFLIDWLFEKADDPAIATHDSALLEHAQTAASRANVDKEGFEIQMLYGVRRELQEDLARRGYRVRCYVPYGSSWYPYLMRRIAERPANIRFFLRALARG